MRRAQMDQLVNDHFQYEATDDVEGVLGTMTEDAEHQVVGGPDGPLRGKARIRLLHVFKLRDGLIEKENVWFDFDEVKPQLS